MDAIEAKEVTLFDALVALYHAVFEVYVKCGARFDSTVDTKLRKVADVLASISPSPATADPVPVIGEDESVAIAANEVYGVGPHNLTGNCIRAMRQTYRSGDAAGFRRGLSTPISGFHRDGCTCEKCETVRAERDAETQRTIDASFENERMPQSVSHKPMTEQNASEARGLLLSALVTLRRYGRCPSGECLECRKLASEPHERTCGLNNLRFDIATFVDRIDSYLPAIEVVAAPMTEAESGCDGDRSQPNCPARQAQQKPRETLQEAMARVAAEAHRRRRHDRTATDRPDVFCGHRAEASRAEVG